MAQRMNTNPWGDAMGQAVGALYKYYATRPTATDMMKQQLMESQLQQAPLETEKMRLANEMSQRQLGKDWYVQGAPASLMEDMAMGGMDPARKQQFINMQHPAVQVDAGDVKRLISPVNAAEIYSTTVGAAPSYKELNKQLVPTDPIPSRVLQNSPMALTAAQYAPTPVPQGPAANMMEPDIMQGAGIMPVTEEQLNAPMDRVGRMPPPSMAPTPAEIAEMMPPMAGGIQVDAPSTSPDVMGYGAQQRPRVISAPPNPADQLQQSTARAQVTDSVKTMANAYKELKRLGGAVSSNQHALTQNLPSYLAGTGLGQTVGRALGTDEQKQRDMINTQKPAIMNAIRQAAEMGVKGMDSEKELQFYLNALGDPTLDSDVSMAALQIINDNLGLGAQRFSDPRAVEQLRLEAKKALMDEEPVSSQNQFTAADIQNMTEEELDQFLAQ